MRARWLWLAAPAVCISMHTDALAQAAPEVSLRADADEIDVGDSLMVTLTAMSDASSPQPSDPQLKGPANVAVAQPMVSSQTQMSINNGRMSHRAGFRAVWRVTPSQVGTFEIGPATFMSGGKRVSAGSVKVTVKPAGQSKPRLRGRRQRDPFGGLFGSPFGLFDDDEVPPHRREREAPVDPQLSLDAPLEPQAFLRTVVDKTTAVVGEQVTLSIYLYTQPRSFQVVDPHEPPAVDFFQRVLSAGGEIEAHSVQVGGVRWNAQLIRKIALFPLKPGKLDAGSMTITLVGPGLRGSGMRGGLVRSSKSAVIDVQSPPLQGRPAGYVEGDVGSYKLMAQVEPRTVEVGGTVAVTAVLRGTGNVPAKLRVPEKKGVVWLEPDIRESIDASGNAVSGSRTFTFMVRLTEPGVAVLGDLSVPYYNPQSKAYEEAKASLGTVTVNGAAPAPSASAAPVVDPLAAIAPAASAPRAWTMAGVPVSDSPLFLPALAAPPLLVLLAQGGLFAASRLRRTREEQAGSPRVKVGEALSAAEALLSGGDPKGAASSIEKALVTAIEASCGVKARGLLRADVAPSMREAGLSAELSDEAAALLSRCDALRFETGAEGEAKGVHERAQELCRQLLSRGRR